MVMLTIPTDVHDVLDVPAVITSEQKHTNGTTTTTTEIVKAVPVRRVSLLDISDDIFALDDLLDESGGEIGEGQEATFDQWFKELGTERDRKIDGYGSLMAELTNRAEVREKRAAEMLELSRIDKKKVEFLKSRLLMFFQAHKITRLDTERFRFTRCTNGGHQPMWCEEAAKLPDNYRRTVIEYKPETDKIRAALKALPDGESLPFAKLLPRGEHIRIK